MSVRASSMYPFVPSGRSFAGALAFYAELGFQIAWRHDGLAGLRWDAAYFMLQDIDVPIWQANQMLVVEVDDLEAYWRAIDAKDLPTRFPGARVKAPFDYPWGREIHVVEPAGVCWHFRAAQA